MRTPIVSATALAIAGATRIARRLANAAVLDLLLAGRRVGVQLCPRGDDLSRCWVERGRDVLAAEGRLGARRRPSGLYVVDRVRRANQAYIARLAVRATNRLFEVSGGHGLFETNAIQRFHRDVNAGSHQTALTWHTNAEEYARQRLALIQ